MYKFSSYDRMQYQQQRRAEAAEIMAKNAQIANGIAAIQNNNVVEQGNIVSKAAMQRLYKRA